MALLVSKDWLAAHDQALPPSLDALRMLQDLPLEGCEYGLEECVLEKNSVKHLNS
jgi:hypothetical protein